MICVVLFFSKDPEHQTEQKKRDDLTGEYAKHKTCNQANCDSRSFEE